VIAGLVVALGFVALALVPIGGLLLVWASIGMPGLTALLVVNGAVMLARSVSPLRAAAWFKKPQADEPGLPMRVLTMETVLTAAAVVLLAATAGWWQPLLGVSVPLWIVVLLAVRASALAMMGALSTLKRPIAAVVLLADIAVVLPLAAVLTRSFTGTVIASTAASCAFAALALHAGTITRLEKKVGKKLDMAEVPEAELRDRWRLGTWLQTMQSNLRRPLIVAMGGAMLAVPPLFLLAGRALASVRVRRQAIVLAAVVLVVAVHPFRQWQRFSGMMDIGEEYLLQYAGQTRASVGVLRAHLRPGEVIYANAYYPVIGYYSKRPTKAAWPWDERFYDTWPQSMKVAGLLVHYRQIDRHPTEAWLNRTPAFRKIHETGRVVVYRYDVPR